MNGSVSEKACQKGYFEKLKRTENKGTLWCIFSEVRPKVKKQEQRGESHSSPAGCDLGCPMKEFIQELVGPWVKS